MEKLETEAAVAQWTLAHEKLVRQLQVVPRDPELIEVLRHRCALLENDMVETRRRVAGIPTAT